MQEPERFGQGPVALGFGRVDLVRRQPEEGEVELPVRLVRSARVGRRRRSGQLGVDLAQLSDLVICRPARRPDQLDLDELKQRDDLPELLARVKLAFHLAIVVALAVALLSPLLAGWHTLTPLGTLGGLESWASPARFVARGAHGLVGWLGGGAAGTVASKAVVAASEYGIEAFV